MSLFRVEKTFLPTLWSFENVSRRFFWKAVCGWIWTSHHFMLITCMHRDEKTVCHSNKKEPFFQLQQQCHKISSNVKTNISMKVHSLLTFRSHWWTWVVKPSVFLLITGYYLIGYICADSDTCTGYMFLQFVADEQFRVAHVSLLFLLSRLCLPARKFTEKK